MMQVSGVIIRIVLVVVISVLLSVLAMNAVKWIGVDIKDFKQRYHPRFLLIAGFFNLLFIVAVALIMRLLDHESIAKLGFTLNGNEILFSIIILLLSVGLGLLFVWYLNARDIIDIEWTKQYFKNSINIFNLLLVFAVLFVAALQEETMFRGYFAFVLLPFGFYYALIISSVLFTAWHFITNKVNLFQTIDWLLGGIMLFYVYWLSGSVWVSAIVHFGRNFTNVLVFNIAGTNSIVSYQEPLEAKYKTIYTIAYSLVIILLGFFYFRYA